MPPVRSRNACQPDSDFDKGRIVAYQDYTVYRIDVLLLLSVKNQLLLAEYKIDGFRTIRRNAGLGQNGPLTLAAKKTSMLPG
ncbi:hypothetical protein TNCV_5081721 [Trichonephila clavipes]|nr:hypothetical protein TNCV_5081721 [Trichonephila clavipes]